MSNISQFTQIINEETNVPIGAIVKSYVSSSAGPSIVDPGDSSFSYVKSGAVYLQSEHPELYSSIGLAEAGAWIPAVSGTIVNDITSSVYGNGLYLIGGTSGYLRSSTDGVTWTIQSSGVFTTINALEYINGQYILATSGSGGTIRTSTDAVTWTTRTSLSSFAGFTSLVYDNINNLYIAVGTRGIAVTSTNLTSWRVQNRSGITRTINSVTYGNGIYVFVGTLGQVSTSTDFNVWTQRSSGTAATFLSVIFGNGVFVAVGTSGTIRTSTDGITWTFRNTETTFQLNDVIYEVEPDSSDRYYAVGVSGIAVTSTDAISWLVLNNSGTSSSLTEVVYANNEYLIGGAGGVLKTSTDGISWTRRTTGTTSSIYSITYGNGIYMYGTEGGGIATSTDTLTWTAQTSGTTGFVYSLAYGNSLFVAAVAGSTNGVRTSTDGVAWTARLSGNDYYSTAFVNNTFLAAGINGILQTSTNGISWTSRVSNTTSIIWSLAYGNGIYLYSTSNGGIGTSTNLSTWAQRNSRTTEIIYSINYDATDGIYWYVTELGSVGTSTDSITWQSGGRNPAVTLNAVAENSNITVMVGNGGLIQTAEPGSRVFTVRSSGTAQNLNQVIWSGTQFVAVGNNGTIVTSTDGISWTVQTSNTVNNINDIAWSGSIFVAVAAFSVRVTSTDGIIWTQRTFVTADEDLNSIAWSPQLNRFVMVGNSGVIYYGSDGINWSAVSPVSTGFATYPIRSIAWSGTRFLIATGLSTTAGNTIISSSPDGINWSLATSFGASQTFNKIASDGRSFIVTSTTTNSYFYSSDISSSSAITGLPIYSIGITWSSLTNRFVMVGTNNIVLTSKDGFNWAPLLAITNNHSVSMRRSISVSGNYIAVGQNGVLSTSTDLNTWSKPGFYTDTANTLNKIIYDGTQYIACGENGILLTTTDSVNWIANSVGKPINVAALDYGNGLYVYASENAVWGTSTNLITWNNISGSVTIVSSTTTGISPTDISYADGIWVATGQTLSTSTDGVNWNLALLSTGTSSSRFTFANKVNDRYVVAGEEGALSFSLTGLSGYTYPFCNTGTTATINGITYGADKFAAITEFGQVLTTIDGVTWTSSGFISSSSAIEFNDNIFVAAGTVIQTSTDAVTWTTRTSVTAGITELSYDNGQWIAVGGSGTVRTSTNAITWVRSFSSSIAILYSVTYGNGLYVITGAVGTLLTTTDPAVLSYSPLYDIATEFYIPQISLYTATAGLTQNVYIKGT